MEIDSIREFTAKLLRDQHALNVKVCAKHGTLNNNEFDWMQHSFAGDWNQSLAVVGELAELAESIPVAWWKAQKADVDNMLVEYVDTLHFMMSQAMAQIYGRTSRSNTPPASLLDDIITIVSNIMTSAITVSRSSVTTDVLAPHRIRACVANTMAASLAVNADGTESFDQTTGRLTGMFIAFFNLGTSLDVSLQTLRTMYAGKRVLNAFRQQVGYGDGAYIKQWSDTHDDTGILFGYLKTLNLVDGQTPSDEFILQFLEETYDSVVSERVPE